jgi:anti-sigma B factor antagonist
MKANLLTSVRKTDNIAVVDIQGEVNASAESILMDSFTEATSSGIHSIILNFSGLEYMNSSGIGLLVTLLIRANRQKLRLLAYGLNQHYLQIFELTRLNEAISIYNNEEEAMRAAANGR